MVFYLVVSIAVALATINNVISFIKGNGSLDGKKDYSDFIRKVLISLFVIAFCLKKLFPDINWL